MVGVAKVVRMWRVRDEQGDGKLTKGWSEGLLLDWIAEMREKRSKSLPCRETRL